LTAFAPPGRQLWEHNLNAIGGNSGLECSKRHHWQFKFRDGKIVEVLEYLDTLAVWKAFGTPDQKVVAKAATEAKTKAA
jgi:hypothetical protein